MSLYYLDPLDSSYYPSDLISSDFRIVTQPITTTRHDQPITYPVYENDSNYNSTIAPVKNIGMDGRLKTKLMGVGTDGGFLTSPLTFARQRVTSATTGSDLRFESPANSIPNSLSGSVNSLNGGAESYRDHLVGLGMEADIGNGLSDLQGRLEMVDYPNIRADYASQRAYYPPSGSVSGKRHRTVSEASINISSNRQHYQEFNNSSSRPPIVPRQHTRDTGAPHTRDTGAPPIHFVEHRFPQSPPLAPKPTSTAPSTPRRVRKVSDGGSISKTLNKVRSCPSLVPGPITHMEPLTPVSSHMGNFLPGVPFNSPTDDAAIAIMDPSIMPFSFADLYNYGLAADSIDNIDPRKSPNAFTNDLLGFESGLNGPATFGDLSDHDFGLLYGLPTPHLAPSGFSSPSTTFNSEPSPPENLISPVLMTESCIAINPPPQIQSRQRCLPYNNRPLPPLPVEANGTLDPALFGPVTGHRHVSTPDFVPNPAYSYPNYGPEPSHLHHLGPYVPSSWHSNQSQVNDFGRVPEQYLSQPQSFISPKSTTPKRPATADRPPRTSSFSAQSGLFSAVGGLFEPLPMPSLDARARDDDSIDLLFEGYGQTDREEAISTAPSTPKKRSRETDDEEYTTDGDGDYKPAFGSPPLNLDNRKRQRVVSAPAAVGRRLRPGPRPKSASRSPQEACQSVFSLSPPPIPFRSVSSPFLSDHSPNFFDDTFTARDSILEANGIPKPIAGDSLPKTVIQSLYNAVPAKSGTKNAKRYICLIEGCDRTFPRKSAIESHIQTHLEDKPFVCPADDCEASFVRQHDLRRHERIHSGNKPFPCPCGKGFARGDALQRHRQRGICSGSTVPRRS